MGGPRPLAGKVGRVPATSPLRASIHVMFRCLAPSQAAENRVWSRIPRSPKAEATGSNPVGCTKGQRVQGPMCRRTPCHAPPNDRTLVDS